jgi:hypothetical protein
MPNGTEAIDGDAYIKPLVMSVNSEESGVIYVDDELYTVYRNGSNSELLANTTIGLPTDIAQFSQNQANNLFYILDTYPQRVIL